MKNFASLASASALGLGLGLCALPASANAGFFDQLFGGAPQAAPQPAPSYGYDEPQSYQDAPVRHRAKRKVAAEEKPKRQKPTDLMHDATLQNGDAVMMKDGIHIYVGDDGTSKHSKSDFEVIDGVADVPKPERNALVALDTTKNDPLRGSISPDTIASGRSAAVSAPVVQGREIVDARGKTLRYVGP